MENERDVTANCHAKTYSVNAKMEKASSIIGASIHDDGADSVLPRYTLSLSADGKTLSAS